MARQFVTQVFFLFSDTPYLFMERLKELLPPPSVNRPALFSRLTTLARKFDHAGSLQLGNEVIRQVVTDLESEEFLGDAVKASLDDPRCVVCQSTGYDVSQCSVCHRTRYCSTACQKKYVPQFHLVQTASPTMNNMFQLSRNWRFHRHVCISPD